MKVAHGPLGRWRKHGGALAFDVTVIPLDVASLYRSWSHGISWRMLRQGKAPLSNARMLESLFTVRSATIYMDRVSLC